MVRRIAFALSAMFLASVGTAQAAEPVTAAGRDLYALLSAADDDDLALNPMDGLARGDLRRAGEFGDLISDAYFAQAEANLRKQLAGLRRIDRARLAPKERIAYDAFRYSAEFALAQHREGILEIGRQLTIEPLFGPQIAFQTLSSGEGAALYRTLTDYENGLTRFDGFVTYLDRAIERMREGMRDGRVQPRVITAKVLVQLDAELANPAEKSPFYRPVTTLPAHIAEPDRTRIAAAYKDRIERQLHPAMKRLRDFMGGEYLAMGRVDKPGLAGTPGGAKYYKFQLQAHTTSKISAAKIHRLGLAEVERILGEMDALRTRVGFEGDRAAFLKYLRDDPRLRFGSAEALLAGYRALQRQVDAALPRLFSLQPRSTLEIRPLPTEQEGSHDALYLVGTVDGQRPGIFYVNTSNLPARTSPRMTALLLHEGMPGHHLQNSLAMEDRSLPPNLRFNWNAGFGEGWALYAEWLGTEMGLYKDPYQYFGRLDMETLRAARLVVDTGLHDRGWSRDQAIDYMLANTSVDRATVEQEVDRYIVWPGQAAAYKIGELFIRDLRSRAEKRLGASFDVRRFHAAVLDTGVLPLHVLGQKVDAWIVEELKRRPGKRR